MSQEARPESPPATVRGVIFDLDGTLIDSYGAITESLNHALSSLGEATLPEASVRRMVGHGLEELVEQVLGAARVGDGVRLFRERYAEVGVRGSRALPGVTTTLAELSRRGYRMGVASNKPARFGEEIVRGLGMEPHLPEVLGPDRVEHPKPHREMVDRLLDLLQLERTEVVYVGDMVVDLQTCRNAGVSCWLIASGSCTADELRSAGGDRLLGEFSELLELLPPLE